MEFNIDILCDLLHATIAKENKQKSVYIERISIDSRSKQNDGNTLFFAVVGNNHNGHRYLNELIAQGVKYFVVSEDLNITVQEDVLLFHVKDTLQALHQLTQYHRSLFTLPVIGITGSKGKTIVKEWLNFLMSDTYNIIKNPKSYNSQVGVPLSVFGIRAENTLGVFEAGISTTSEMANLEKLIQPSIGILTALTEEHADGFESLEQKLEEKLQLFSNCSVVICEYDLGLASYLTKQELFTWSFTSEEADLFVLLDRGTLRFKYRDLPHFEINVVMTDEYSIKNITTCVLTLLYFGYSVEDIQARVSKLYPVELRLQVKKGINNCTLIDDAYNCDYQSLVIALDLLEKHKIGESKTVILSDLFTGGTDEEVLYRRVYDVLANYQITKLICIGERLAHYLKGLERTWFYETTDEFIHKVSIQEFEQETILVKGSRGFRFDKISSLLEDKTHETVLEINLTAIRHNLNFYRSKLHSTTQVMVMVKAFGYGNGSFEIAKLLAHEKVSYLGVAFADEGIELRKAGVTIPIIVMNPEISAFSAMIAYDLEPEVYSVKELNAFVKIAREKNSYTYPIHIKLDTGMHRHGFLSNELDELILALKNNNVVEVKSVFSHLSSSDMPEYNDFTLAQIEMFTKNADKLCEALSIHPLRHILNTSGIYHFPEHQMDMVRLGIGLYGIGNDAGEMAHLQNVSTLKTRIMQIKEIEVNESIGYGRKFRTPQKAKVATIPIGYADGIHRSWGNEVGYVLVNGKKATIIGSICMDMMMIDVTTIPCKEEDSVIVFGEELPVTLISSRIETIPYEILTSISQRVKRIFYEE